MKNFLIIGLFLLSSFSIFGQDDTKAKQLLDEVSVKVASYDNITLSFDYILDNKKENVHQKTNGTVRIQGEKYHLNFMGIERIYDTNKIYTIVHEDEEVVISDGDNAEDSEFTPSKILTFYQKGYNFVWDKKTTIAGKQIQFIKLLPISTKAENKFILLGIDMKSKNIHQVIYTNQKDTNTTFRISSFKTNKTLPANEFSFVEEDYIAKDYIITKL